MAQRDLEHGEQGSSLLWPTPEPPTELRGLILAAAVMAGAPALVLVVFDGITNPGTAGAVGLIAVSVLLTFALVRRVHRPLSGGARSAVLALSSLLLIGAYVLGGNPVTVLATSVPFGFAVGWTRPRWIPALAGILALAAAIALRAAVHPDGADGRDLVTGGIYFGASLLGFAGTSIGWQMQQRVDRHHAVQTELTLARERLRFATDFHDIQGHTLLAIKMKAELARRSLERDPARVRRELEDIEDLAAQAGDQTRQLAQGYRTLTLSAELANLEQLLGAAGIQVRIERRGAPAREHEELLATLVREAASNILRHADAGRVDISLAATSVTVRNDGAGREEVPVGHGGSGLEGLRRRFAAEGGTVSWHHDGEQFTVTGSIGGSA